MGRSQVTAHRDVISVLAIAGLVSTLSGALAANDPNALDSQTAPSGMLRPVSEPPARAGEPQLRGNPLWGMPLSSLHFTRERPLFVPSRRPPAPAVVAARPPPAKPPPPAAPEQLTLSLVGIVIGANEGIAIFTDNTTHDIVRLRTGEGHRGWILRSVAGREAVFERDNRTIAVALPAINGDQK